MGFREFISSYLFRQKLKDNFQTRQNHQFRANPPPQYIDELVMRLRNDKDDDSAFEELKEIGSRAIPSLIATFRDSQFRNEVERNPHAIDQPFSMILSLLLEHCPDEIMADATALIRAQSSEIRKAIAVQLASLGRDDTIPLLGVLLNDPDGFVRSYVKIGVLRAVDNGRCSDHFRKRMYQLFLIQCDQEWEGNINDAAAAVVKLDANQAAIDFSNLRWLTSTNPYVYKILRQCNYAGIRLPEHLVQALLDHSMPKATGNGCYPHDFIVAGALESLALSIGDRAKPMLLNALTSDREEIQESAGRAIAKLAGVQHPTQYVCELEESIGFNELSKPQRVIYCAFWFDAEVCNGGLMQFFGNCYGMHAAETLEAMRELEHPAAIHALDEAMRLIGPQSRQKDREKRLAAFEGRFDEFEAAFQPLESKYYSTQGILRQRMMLYAAQHSSHFR